VWCGGGAAFFYVKKKREKKKKKKNMEFQSHIFYCILTMLRSGLRRCLNAIIVRKCNSNSNLQVGYSRSQSGSSWSGKSIGFGSLLTLAAALLGKTYIDGKQNMDAIERGAKRFLSPSDIQHSSTTSLKLAMLQQNDTYVSRPTLESAITSIVNRQEANAKYFVVYGPKGVGKSVLIDKCVQGQKGVVKVLIGSVFDKRGILQVLSTDILGKRVAAVNEGDMVNILDNAKVDGILPTLIFEIELGQAEQTAGINNVRSLCKQFAVCSNCIIILSETNEVLMFGQDIDREEFILVPELTRVEALEFVRRRRRKGIALDEKEIMHLFENVGTTALTLEAFLKGTMSVDEFIAHRMAAAKHDLIRCPFQPILRALKAHPEGVSPAYFKKEECKGVDMSSPVAVGKFMTAAQSNAVFFNMNEGVYKLNSCALKVALRSFEPVSS
jgi:hypothetical protein